MQASTSSTDGNETFDRDRIGQLLDLLRANGVSAVEAGYEGEDDEGWAGVTEFTGLTPETEPQPPQAGDDTPAGTWVGLTEASEEYSGESDDELLAAVPPEVKAQVDALIRWTLDTYRDNWNFLRGSYGTLSLDTETGEATFWHTMRFTETHDEEFVHRIR